MSEEENGGTPHNIAENIEFWLEHGLNVDEMFDLLKTAKGNHILDGSKTSAMGLIKDILAVLIHKNEKLEVASRELEVATSELEVASHTAETYRIENVRLMGECAGFKATNNVLQAELEKAVKGAPVGLLRD